MGKKQQHPIILLVNFAIARYNRNDSDHNSNDEKENSLLCRLELIMRSLILEFAAIEAEAAALETEAENLYAETLAIDVENMKVGAEISVLQALQAAKAETRNHIARGTIIRVKLAAFIAKMNRFRTSEDPALRLVGVLFRKYWEQKEAVSPGEETAN